MAKKRGKPRPKSISKKISKRPKAAKEIVIKSSEAQKPMKDALHELEILAEEKKVENKESSIEKKEESIEKKENIIVSEEKKIEAESKHIEKLEKEIKKEVSSQPLKKFSLRDLNKGIIGAFIGVVADYAFLYGKELSKSITYARASVLLIFSYFLVILLLYETGYRVVNDKKYGGVFPVRATLIFLTSILVIMAIFFLFNQIDFSDFGAVYRQVAVTSVLAALGAGTADLIGRS